MIEIEYDYDESWSPKDRYLRFELEKCERFELPDGKYRVSYDEEKDSFVISSRQNVRDSCVIDAVIDHIIQHIPDGMSHSSSYYTICIVSRPRDNDKTAMTHSEPCFSHESADGSYNMESFCAPNEEADKRKRNRERIADEAKKNRDKTNSVHVLYTPMING